VDRFPEFTILCAKHFSTEELRGVLDFYKSPVGRALLSKLPAYEEEMVRHLYPRLYSSAERHWLAVVAELRAQGKKL
jgi:hypothetical protein